MKNDEFNSSLDALGLTQGDAAILLRVTPRAVRKWQVGEQRVPGTVSELVSAWRQLHAASIPWGTDLESIWYGDDAQIRLHQDHDRALVGLLERVKARGGHATPWRINLREHRAILGKVTVGFYKLASGSFSLANYRRGDMPTDLRRDQLLIEDAVAAFAAEVSKAKTARPSQDWDD